MLDEAFHLFRDMVGNHVGDGRWKMGNLKWNMWFPTDFRPSPLAPRPSTLKSPTQVSNFRSHPLPVRALSGFLFALLFLTSSPVAMAITMGEVRSGVVPGQSGGRGSASNLQNAGAASAAMTATLARQSIHRSDTAVGAMRAMQQNAAAAARAAARSGNPTLPNGQTVNGSSVIPNGLAANWLHPHDGFDGSRNPLTTSWRGAGINLQKTGLQSSGDHNVEITQSSQNAYLYWKDFNVGPRTTINFDQSKGGADAGKWIAFNKITGNASPSSIYGKITAQGQVYILNQNGIMFHNGSEVNVHALVASTLPINPYFAGDPMNGIEGRGLLNNTDYQFLFSALKLSSSQNYPETWDPGNGTPIAASAIGGLKIEKGALISTAKPNGGTGGRVMLVGPSVRNDGTISTPDGQTILAAGLQVGVNAHPSSDPSLRGLDVHIGRVVDDADRTAAKSFSTDQSGTRVGTAVNNGLIEMPRGHAAMVGRDLTQSGIIESSTSVTLNGRVDLQAVFNAVVPSSILTASSSPYWYEQTLPGGTTGSIHLGSASVIRILPETSSAETLPGTKVSLSSIIAIMGNSVRGEGGSIVLAPGAKPVTGDVNENIYYDMTRSARNLSGDLSSVPARLDSGISVTAGNWYRPASEQFGMFVTGAVGTSAQGQITLDPGSLISVAGSTGIEINGARNFQTIELRGPELSNFPLQRESVFRGKKITIDTRMTGTYDGGPLAQKGNGFLVSDDANPNTWVGTPLGYAKGYVSLIGKTAGELTADGGSIALRAGDRVDVGSGAVLDVSGGWVRFSETTYATTKLLFNGLPVDISKATPDMVYERVVENAGSMTEIPYYEGGRGGSLTIQAPRMTLAGSMRGGVVIGARQLRPVSGDIHLPDPASLNLSILQSRIYSGSLLVPASPYAPQLVIGSASSASPFTINQIRLDSGIFGSSGFGHLSVLNHDGSILLPRGASLNLGPGGSANLSASSLDIDGTVSAPGGSISLSAYNVSYDERINLDNLDFSRFVGYESRGIIRIGSSSILSTKGLVANDFTDRSLASTVMLDGGSVSISALDVGIERGSLIDVSAGAWVGSNASIKVGSGGSRSEKVRGGKVRKGSILIEGGQDLEVRTIRDGTLTLAGQLRGFGGVGSQSGELSIKAPAIQIGGITGDARILMLNPSFFSAGGFSHFNLTGIGFEAGTGSADEEIPGIRIASGAVVNPLVRNILYRSTTGLSELQMPSGMSPAVTLDLIAQGLVDPKSPNSPGYVVRGKVAIDKGAVIRIAPSISLPSRTSTTPMVTTGSLSVEGRLVDINGNLSAFGGAILISGANGFPENFSSPPGKADPTVRVGSGARISTAGTSLFMPDPLGLGRRLGAVLEGGDISLKGNLQLKNGSVLDVSGTSANRFVASGLSRTRGGDLMIQSSGGSITLNGGQMLESQGTLLGKAGGASALGGTLSVSSGRFYNLNNPAEQVPDPRDVNLIITQDLLRLGARIVGDRNAKISSKGYFAADSANSGGFENLILGGNVEFSGPVSITLPGSLRVASSGTIRTDSLVTLKAGHAVLGSPLVGARKTDDTTKDKAFGGDGDRYVGPSGGNGSLQVEARLIELGNLLLANFSSASFFAPGGIIRGDGAVNIAGNLILRAAQIHPVTASRMSFAAYDPTGDPALGKGSILVEQSGRPLSLPLSAGGELSLYASIITQNGTLLSPFGTINLGWDGTGASPRDPVSGAGIHVGVSIPVTETLTMGASGKTSISAIDPLSGVGVTIPYGIIINGTQWIAPTGVDIASVGLPSKGVNLSAISVNTLGGSSIDLRGGGELAAFQWISGLKGTRDLAAPSSGSYAILPSFRSEFIPVANFADPLRTAGDPGYTSIGLTIGDRITLASGSGLAAGTYTLLPARYALYPGGFLITPTGNAQERQPASRQMPDGSALVAGIRYNDTRGGRPVQDVTEIYKVTSPSLLAQSADYRLLKASESLPKTPSANPVIDAGRLVIKSTGVMNLLGGVQGAGGAGGRGSSIDISSSKDFQIGGNASAGTIALNAAALSSWNAGSLLIGGIRSITSTGISITPGTSKVIVDNAGTPLSAGDLILAAKDGIIFRDNAVISSTGSGAASRIDIRGNGAVVRASTDSSATVTRTEYDKGAPVTGYEIGNGTRINGESIILESSGLGFISDSAILSANAYGIVAGSIAVGFDGTKRDRVLNLVGRTLEKLSLAKKVDIISYGSIELLGGGVFGSDATESISLNARAIVATEMGDGIVSLNAGTILLGNSAGASRTPLGAKAEDGSPLMPSGTLELNAQTILIGENDLSLDRFSYVSLNASGVLAGSGKGGLHAGTTPMTYTTIAGDSLEALSETYGVTTEAIEALNRDKLAGQDLEALSGGLAILISQTTDLFVTAPFVTGIQGSKTTITSSGGMRLMAPDPEYVTQSSVTAGLGSKLTLEGSTLSINTSIVLPSGEFAARATAGDLIIGTGGMASLNVGGTSKTINSVTQFTDAGSIEFSSAGGEVIIGQYAGIMLNAAEKGSAGSLAILAPALADTVSGREAGTLSLEDGAVIQALAGFDGDGGSLKLDLGELALISQLGFGRTEEGEVIGISEAGFTKSMDLRVRNGDLAIDNYLVNRNVTITADNGSITVTPDGVIDASGKTTYDDDGKAIKPQHTTGGRIALQASGSVILEPNSALTVRGETYDNAGKGGSVFLSAGAAVERMAEDGSTYLDINRDATLDLQTASSIDLGVTAAPTRSDQFGGTLHLRAPIMLDGSDIQIAFLGATIDPQSFNYTTIVGDTLDSAAAQLGISLEQLLKANNLTTTSTLNPGTVLRSLGSSASSIAVEGYRAYDLTGQSVITDDLRTQIVNEASTFFSKSGEDSEIKNSDIATEILSRLTDNKDPDIRHILNLAPGVEIINRTGDLTLNTDWDLSGFRTGAKEAPGFLSLRAAGDLIFNATLSDGFVDSTYSANLLQYNSLLSPNFQSWGYDICAGSDFSSASLNALKKNTEGNIWIGKTSVKANVVDPNARPGDALTSQAVNGFFQVLRTGTGNISLHASGSIRLMNQFATIYTAGSKAADQGLSGAFDVPGLADSSETLNFSSTILGRDQQPLDEVGIRSFDPVYSLAGGNIMLSAGNNIEHLQPDPDLPGGYVADSSRQLPVNWLSRRGKIAENGLWDVIEKDGVTEVSSSTWWVNFPSFFQGIGTLGGGNISMLAGGNVSNVDASLPTQGRMTGKSSVTLAVDTRLGGIATQYGITLATLATMNGITEDISTDGAIRLSVGRVLSIPDGSGETYKVVSGDTLMKVADEFGVTSSDLAAANNLSLRLSVGRVLSIPDSSGKTYTVAYDDTLKKVADKFEVTPSQLATANNLSLADYVLSKDERFYVPIAPSLKSLVETGGGDLLLRAGGNLDAGVYYTERGNGVIKASGDIISNPTRDVYGDYLHSIVKKDPTFRSKENQAKLTQALLPTSFFLGKGSFSVTAGGDALLGPVGNVFLQPQGINNDLLYKTYFSTYDEESSFSATSLVGDITLRTKLLKDPAFASWLSHSMLSGYVKNHPKPGEYQPWILIAEQDPLDGKFGNLPKLSSLMPGRMNVTALSGDLSLQGDLTLSPSRVGGLSFIARGSIKGVSQQIPGESWSASVINVSDASPTSMPSSMTPRSQSVLSSGLANLQTDTTYLGAVGAALTETASYAGINDLLNGKLARHDQTLLHRNDPEPIRIIADTGSLSGVELFAPKKTEIKVGGDLYDVAIAIQHLSRSDVSIISAGGEMRLYDANNPDLLAAIEDLKNRPPAYARPQPRSGDIQISGPGTLQVIAGGNIDLGTGDVRSDRTGVGITSIGNARNPALPFEGASLITMAGASLPGSLADAGLNADGFFGKVSAMSGAGDYFKELKNMVLGNWESSISSKLSGIQSVQELKDDPSLTEDEKSRLALSLFYIVLRESGRDFNDVDSPTYRTYKNGQDAIAAYLPAGQEGSIVLNSRDIRTKSGGAISMLAPGGAITLSPFAVSQSLTPPGIVTESGGTVNIYTKKNVDIGIGRIFTLRGGDIMIWSNLGNIAAGSSAKTVATAPPTRVLLDPQSGDVLTDLAGLATGGGIGVLAAVAGVRAGDVDLIAPTGYIDAGDAGIRSLGNLNLAAEKILNADNILAGGVTVGAPPPAAPSAPPVAAPPPAAPPAGATAAAAAGNSAAENAADKNARNDQAEGAPSIISVEVLGYGGGDGENEEKKAANAAVAPVQASL
jgi:filamentous hemagglutinin family protein